MGLAAVRTLDETCFICGRACFGEIVRTGFGHWRHDTCALGSEEWREFYLSLPSARQAALREFFNFSYPHEEGMQP